MAFSVLMLLLSSQATGKNIIARGLLKKIEVTSSCPLVEESKSAIDREGEVKSGPLQLNIPENSLIVPENCKEASEPPVATKNLPSSGIDVETQAKKESGWSSFPEKPRPVPQVYGNSATGGPSSADALATKKFKGNGLEHEKKVGNGSGRYDVPENLQLVPKVEGHTGNLASEKIAASGGDNFKSNGMGDKVQTKEKSEGSDVLENPKSLYDGKEIPSPPVSEQTYPLETAIFQSDGSDVKSHVIDEAAWCAVPTTARHLPNGKGSAATQTSGQTSPIFLESKPFLEAHNSGPTAFVPHAPPVAGSFYPGYGSPFLPRPFLHPLLVHASTENRQFAPFLQPSDFLPGQNFPGRFRAMSRHQIFPETDLLRTRKATSFRFNPNLPSKLHVNNNPLNLAVYDAHHLMSYSQRAHMRESELARDDSGKDLTEEFWRNDPASHLVPSGIQNRYSTKTTEGILGRAPQKASLQMLSEFARHMPTSKRPDFRQIKALCRVMQMSKDGKTVIPNFIEAFEPFVKGEEKLEINFQIETSQNQPEFADVTQAMSRTLSEDLKKLWGKEVIQQWQAVDIKDFYLANRLALHLNVLRTTDYLPLNRMNSYLFQMLCDSWKTAWQDLIKMQYWARQYLGEAEGMRRVWTLSLQILQRTIMERWKNVKKKLLIQDEDSSSPVNKIEKAYQLATPNIDLIYIIENFPPTKILEDKIGEQQTVSLLLNNAMGTRQVYARIQDARYLKGYKGSLLKSLSHNMAQAAEKLGLNVCRVLAVSEALRLEFKEDSSALVFQKSIANIIKMLENEMFEVKDTFFQWYDSPERGWLIQTFQDRYQQRLNLLCEQKIVQTLSKCKTYCDGTSAALTQEPSKSFLWH
ncbi:hypothetical protein O181_065035 [Austropuccinia psidii MF-1]|uniref:Uncharacterized protein n=1 Tax=Austropuccinia psidii MF-1 TaxID=1389203 RepID=A0A9Q3EUB0_9BASI|nr:hypothetical protein [Austropuccinia psidii MF-1]